jgi:serine/threonine-protein kinase
MHRATFRMEGEGGASTRLRSTAELQNRLRRRLRLIVSMVMVATGALGVLGASLHWNEIRSNHWLLFTQPPLPGVLVLIALVAGVLVTALRRGGELSLVSLRAIEWTSIVMVGAFCVINQVRTVGGMADNFAGYPMEVGAAQGAPWGILIIGFSVLVPSGLRHGVVRTVVIACAAFLPDLILNTALPSDGLANYLVLKLFVVSLMTAFALYGAYRVEVLGQDVEAAKEMGQYVLRRSLGEGGMGQVYLAEHRFLRRPCAVKMIRPDQAHDEVALARFEREVQSAAALTHPNTVQVYDYGRSDDGTFYFAMEFLPGTSLGDIVELHGPFEPARAVHVLRQLCGALQEAHDRGLVHRDIKPGNAMLCERGGIPDVVKLLDFGLVTPVTTDATDARLTHGNIAMGTPAYMSPEQCMGEAVTPASDIYSLGALGYFLLTGVSPFGGRSAVQQIVAHLHEVPRRVTELRAGIPEPVANAIARCLEKKPGDRYPSAAALNEALAQALDVAALGDRNARLAPLWNAAPTHWH